MSKVHVTFLISSYGTLQPVPVAPLGWLGRKLLALADGLSWLKGALSYSFPTSREEFTLTSLQIRNGIGHPGTEGHEGGTVEDFEDPQSVTSKYYQRTNAMKDH
ncbi:MAG: hypothetical protein M1818_004954 [Claussenomyces sp. TS43310]|nr:MAG: hypothetical protein M1818_004954 [Claussenomyces sp. TS43310]